MKQPIMIAALMLALGLTATLHGQEPDPSSAPPAPIAEPTPVASFAMRASVVIRDGDEQVLRRGLSLHIAASGNGLTIVEYGLKDGRITYAVTSGTIGDGERKAIEKAIARLQKRLDR